MTAPLPPSTDELVSAYLDGDAAPDEIAAVESSPELMARVEEMREAIEALAAPVAPPPDDVRAAHLSAALGEFDDLVARGEFDAAPSGVLDEPGVVSFAAARQRRRPRRLSMVAAAAAATALVFTGIVAFGLNRGTSQDVVDATSDGVAVSSAAAEADTDADDSFTTSTDTADEALATESAPQALDAPETEEAAEPESAAAAAPPIATPLPPSAAPGTDEAVPEDDESADSVPADLPDDSQSDFADEAEPEAPEEESAGAFAMVQKTSDLGVFVSLDDLGTELEDWLRASTAIEQLRTVDPEEVPSVCAGQVQTLVGIETASLLATATVEGRAVEVHAVDSSQVLVLDAEECRPLLEVNV